MLAKASVDGLFLMTLLRSYFHKPLRPGIENVGLFGSNEALASALAGPGSFVASVFTRAPVPLLRLNGK